MLHHEASRLLPDLAAGALRPADERRVRQHLEECEDCRFWLDTYGLLADGLGEVGAATVHPPSEQLARLAVDRELLSTGELEVLLEHLEECRDCRREQRLAGNSLAALERPQRAAGWRRLATPAVAWRVAAAAALVAALGITFDAGTPVPLPGERLAAAPAAPAPSVALPDRPDVSPFAAPAAEGPAAEGPVAALPQTPPAVAAPPAPAAPPGRLAARPQDQLEVLTAGRVLTGTRVIEAAGQLDASAVTVAVGARVTLRSGDSVVLGDGFAVGDGASLKIESTRGGRARRPKPA